VSGAPRRSGVHLRPYIEWAWVGRWLADLPKIPEGQYSNLAQRDELHSVQVIDVLWDCIIPLRYKSEYLALSYM
jgi:hypothetical protein